VNPALATADRRALYGYALHLTHDRASADDLVQDTLVRALRYRHTYRSGASVDTWLRTILRNVFIDAWHRDRRATSFRNALRSLPSPEPVDFDPAQVLAAIAQLPDDQRIAVTLRELDGLTYAEIAEQTGAPIGTVMSRLRRGRTRLHALLLDHAMELGLVDAATSTRPRFRH
jgi:RNA polymerase sigma-70 factor (ECF subfamily)